MARANHIDGYFARISLRELRSPAFEKLSPLAVKVRLILGGGFWESNGENPIHIPCRPLAERIGCGRSLAHEALRELVQAGYLEKVGGGASEDRETPSGQKKIPNGPKSGRAVLYRLTWEKTRDGRPATFEYLRKKQHISTSGPADTTSSPTDATSNPADVGNGLQAGQRAGKGKPVQELSISREVPATPSVDTRHLQSPKLCTTLEAAANSDRADSDFGDDPASYFPTTIQAGTA